MENKRGSWRRVPLWVNCSIMVWIQLLLHPFYITWESLYISLPNQSISF